MLPASGEKYFNGISPLKMRMAYNAIELLVILTNCPSAMRRSLVGVMPFNLSSDCMTVGLGGVGISSHQRVPC